MGSYEVKDIEFFEKNNLEKIFACANNANDLSYRKRSFKFYMDLFIKTFSQLTNEDLYEILKLRVDVFVVEQNCPYPDIDNRDRKAIHVFLKDDEGIEAYLRIMDRGVESENVSIGRVIARKRRQGLGSKIMNEGIKAAREIFNADTIYIEAQTYAKGFYERLGFRQVSEEFALDGIPHIKMEISSK